MSEIKDQIKEALADLEILSSSIDLVRVSVRSKLIYEDRNEWIERFQLVIGKLYLLKEDLEEFRQRLKELENEESLS